MFTLKHNYIITPHTTFGLNAQVAYYTELTCNQDLPQLCLLPEFNTQTVCWLGGGSNILFMNDFPYLVVRLATQGIHEISRSGSTVLIEAQAGENWHNFVQTTLNMGLSGLENLSLIPGTVGASPVQNIGAYGVEVKDKIHSVNCFDLEKQAFITLSNRQCQFAYRDSLFKHQGKKRYVIVSVVFALSTDFKPHAQYGDLANVLTQICPNRRPTAHDVSHAVCQIRREKLPDPAILGNVGSFYKNPIISSEHAKRIQAAFPDMPAYPQADGNVKLAAGWLIDQCHLKGYTLGGAAVHDKQALVLVNKNHATAADVQALSNYICQQVWQKFTITLQPEPVWLPES